MQYYFEPLEIPGKEIPEKFRNQFEYLFFYLEPEKSLASRKIYSKDFLKKLSEDFLINAKVVDYKRGDQNYWFFENQLVLLNKIKIYELLKDLKLWDHEIYVANSEEDLKEGNYLSKTPFGFSGRGVRPLGKTANSAFPFLVEERLDKVKDFSYFHENGDLIFYENRVGQKFEYLGSKFKKNLMPDFSPWLKKEGISSKDILLFQERVETLDKCLKSHGFKRYNVDCFTYFDEGELRVHIACDINLRKTMGYLLAKIYQKHFYHYPNINFNLSKGSQKGQGHCLSPFDGEEFTISYTFGSDSL